MSTLSWIIAGGVAMSLLALVGGLTLLLPERVLARALLPMVALAAGALFGGAVFHMLPGAVEQIGNDLSVYVWLAAGFVSFFVLEQFLHWHHCHRSMGRHEPLGYMILIADAGHNLVGGVAVGAAFLVDIELGVITWLAAAAHEVPQEVGDFAILLHSGWSPRAALGFNVASALTFLVGGLLAYAVSGQIDVALLLPFAAGNFLYIAAADLIPQMTSAGRCAEADETRAEIGQKLRQSAAFLLGVLLLLAATAFD